MGVGRYKVFMTDTIWPDVNIEREGVSKIPGVDFSLSKGGTPEEICEEGKDCDALMVLFTPMSAKYLEYFTRCKVLVRMGIGFNSVDLAKATEMGIMVANVPDYCQEEVADHTIALFLEITRKAGLLDRDVKAGGWTMELANPVPRLQGKTFGLFGCGGIGQRTGKRAAAFGMNLAGYDPFAPEDLFERENIKRYDSLEKFVSEVDVLSLHIPLSPETKGIVNTAMLERMKPTSYLINTSRGPLVNEEDLYDALVKGLIAGAALDVLNEEPPKSLPKIATAPNIVITPHAGWNSLESLPELRAKSAEEVVRTYREGRPKFLINKEVLNKK